MKHWEEKTGNHKLQEKQTTVTENHGPIVTEASPRQGKKTLVFNRKI